ncbi:Hypothetical predicted protein [Mytilus galloprovincialis]|uniref:Uncharacterized protein n=1 Tax=Mytilus galloprovincialis TaxID=29158 RepID=A0A8B6FMT0_MYTGA|nr:Hypothetical predicted protein [Mytilus galloprovincialis]
MARVYLGYKYRVVRKVENDKANSTLVIPEWKSAPFWPLLFASNNLTKFIKGLRLEQNVQAAIDNSCISPDNKLRSLANKMSSFIVGSKAENISKKPIFRSKGIATLIHQNKKMSYTSAKENIVKRIRIVAPNLNLCLHSLRSGGATAAAQSDVNERFIKRHGRWKSDTSKDGYIDDTFEKRMLSGFASKQLTEGNPNFTDLSDKNRPTKIAENFHAVYDDEWTNALEVLSSPRKGKMIEDEAIHKLMNLVKEIYKFCCSTATDQTLNIAMNILKPYAIDTQPGGKDDGKVFRPGLEPKIKLLRREYCMEPIANITEKFKRTSEDFKIMQKYPGR